MKKTIITILKLICIFLPIFSAGNKMLFEAAVIIWPIAVICLLVFYIKGYNSYQNTRDVLDVYRRIDDVEKNKKSKKEEVTEETNNDEEKSDESKGKD